MTAERYTDHELEAIRLLQRMAYDAAQDVAETIQPGVTEREAAARLGEALRSRGVEGFFHTPFAWFGDRTGFYGFHEPSWRRPHLSVAFASQFFPTDRRLERGMPAILDVAPIRDGLCADIGYAFAIGGNAAQDRALELLRQLRDLILERVRRGDTMADVYRAVDHAIADAGYESAHTRYPSRVLAHKIGRIPWRGLPATDLAGFDARTYLYFVKQLALALPGLGRVPLWNATRLAARRPDPGLWAFEPHVRKDGVGTKWEEILLITDSDARWLDDDLPHMRVQTPRAA